MAQKSIWQCFIIKYLRSSAHAAELCKVNSEKHYKTRCFDIKLNKVHVLYRIKDARKLCVDLPIWYLKKKTSVIASLLGKSTKI